MTDTPKRRGRPASPPRSEGGRRLRAILDDVRQGEALSRATGVSVSQLHRLAAGTSLPSLAVAIELERAAGIDPHSWTAPPTTAT